MKFILILVILLFALSLSAAEKRCDPKGSNLSPLKETSECLTENVTLHTFKYIHKGGLVVTIPKLNGKPVILYNGNNTTITFPSSNGLVVTIPGNSRPPFTISGNNIVVTIPPPASGGLTINFPKDVKPPRDISNSNPVVAFPTSRGGGTIKFTKKPLVPIRRMR
jgi:hypothetical protein